MLKFRGRHETHKTKAFPSGEEAIKDPVEHKDHFMEQTIWAARVRPSPSPYSPSVPFAQYAHRLGVVDLIPKNVCQPSWHFLWLNCFGTTFRSLYCTWFFPRLLKKINFEPPRNDDRRTLFQSFLKKVVAGVVGDLQTVISLCVAPTSGLHTLRETTYATQLCICDFSGNISYPGSSGVKPTEGASDSDLIDRYRTGGDKDPERTKTR
jgi:hypothetical protein